MKSSYFKMLVLSSLFMLLLSSCGNEKKSESTDAQNIVEQNFTEISPEVLLKMTTPKFQRPALHRQTFNPPMMEKPG